MAYLVAKSKAAPCLFSNS